MKTAAILQSESAECGLACIAMVSTHHGRRCGLQELRQRFSLSLKGANLTQLVSIANELGLESRPLRLDLQDLGKLKLPCILHWDMNHFVVLDRVGRRSVRILDPAFGEREITLDEVSPHFTGIALELTPGLGFVKRKAPSAMSLRQLTGPVSGLARTLGLILSLSLGLQVCISIAPFLLQLIIDQVLVSADVELLTALAVGFGLLMILQVSIGLLRGWTVIFLSNSIGQQWTANVFAHLIRLPLDYFEKRHLGDVTSRLGAVQSIQRTLTTSFVEVVIDGLMAAITLTMMLLYSVKLTLLTLLAVSIYLALRSLAFRPIRTGTERQLIAAARQESHLLESIRGMQSVKVAGCEAQRKASYLNLLTETINRDVGLARFNLGFNSASQLIFGVERVAVIWLGARLALDNVFSVGMLIAYLTYKEQFSQRAGGLIDKWIELRMLKLHGERLSDIVLAEPETGSSESCWPLHPVDSSVEVENLSFRYAQGEPWVVRNCSFSIKHGESVAIVGASGCGKSTLTKLLLGLLEPTEGVIRVGGVDIKRLGPTRYRAKVGAVMQDDQLFAGSIAENIAFGFDEYDAGRVEEVARLASIHTEISMMPMGYQSLVGDMGTTLSGGQKQRVILARALYRDPEILFLDEATSHLDVDCEQLVNQSIRALRLTRVIVAHRPETIASADRVLEMHEGRLLDLPGGCPGAMEPDIARAPDTVAARWDPAGVAL